MRKNSQQLGLLTETMKDWLPELKPGPIFITISNQKYFITIKLKSKLHTIENIIYFKVPEKIEPFHDLPDCCKTSLTSPLRGCPHSAVSETKNPAGSKLKVCKLPKPLEKKVIEEVLFAAPSRPLPRPLKDRPCRHPTAGNRQRLNGILKFLSKSRFPVHF